MVDLKYGGARSSAAAAAAGGTDAVSLIEQGRFSTEGIFTHTMPLSEVQRGFEIASQYLEEVVKLVIEL